MSPTIQKPRIYRKDFKPSPYYVKDAVFDFLLGADETIVTTLMSIERREETAGDLTLNGDELELLSVKVNEKELRSSEYKIGTIAEPGSLIIPKIYLSRDGKDKVEIVNKCFPSTNTKLSGLYVSRGLLVTQCEPEGFRRITYFIDQPSSMSKNVVRLRASKKDYPILLSNGDVTHEEDKGDVHEVEFTDPFPKPAHLFAIVAGNLISESAKFKTMSGREVTIHIMAQAEYEGQLKWALECALKAFKWDEEKFGREYDLDTYRAVGVSDFNMGAMENKSLNIFNISAIVAKEDRTRDFYFTRVASVVAHEYFHNWSGNRVSLQDWFQIQLKEGFTSFREALFMEDHFGKASERIQAVENLRTWQFPEDAGPTSHSVRPESYVDIDNFYTPTIYKKGLEVIRLYRTLLGPQGFRKGCDLYFSRYDGMAVSCEEFKGAMAEANSCDLSQFELWYTQRRTPRLSVISHGWDAVTQSYKLCIKQTLPDDAAYGEPVQPMLIPIVCGFVGRKSKCDVRPEVVLRLTQWEQDFSIPDVPEDCVPSLLRGFSAPVILDSYLETEELAFLMTYDPDEFNMYESTHMLVGSLIIARTKAAMEGKYEFNSPPPLPQYILEAVSHILGGGVEDLGLASLCLSRPKALAARSPGLSPYLLGQVGISITAQIAGHFEKELMQKAQELEEVGPVKIDLQSINKRSLRNTCLTYLCSLWNEKRTDIKEMLIKEFEGAANYNDKFHVGCLLSKYPNDADIRPLMAKWYNDCKSITDLTVNDWFTANASGTNSQALQHVKFLYASHEDMKGTKNPNRMRSLVMPAIGNSCIFHDPSGQGYDWLAQILIEWDQFNTPIAAVVAKQLVAFSQFDSATQNRMRSACRKVFEYGRCTDQLKEIVGPACQN